MRSELGFENYSDIYVIAAFFFQNGIFDKLFEYYLFFRTTLKYSGEKKRNLRVINLLMKMTLSFFFTEKKNIPFPLKFPTCLPQFSNLSKHVPPPPPAFIIG